MDMVRVDSKLFILCRLCLEVSGTYQVTPNVAEEIEYCFGIHVDQYDGLPQLICEKCHKILNEYTTCKRLFVGRQNALKTQLQVRKEVEESLAPPPPQQEAVSSSQQVDDSEPVIQRPSKSKKRKSRIISSSSSASSSRATSRSSSLLTERSRSSKRKSGRREPWEEYFNKRYACRICPKQVTSNITNHLKTHADIFTEHKHILDRPCEVRLIKFDSQPNLTGNPNTVVLRPDKILGKKQENSFVIYTVKDNTNIAENRNEPEAYDARGPSDAEAEKQSDEEDDDLVVKRNSNKRPRLLSTDTVVLNDDNKNPASSEKERVKPVLAPNTVIECIDLDDSSNGSSQTNDEGVKDTASSLHQPKDLEAIKNIIKVCHSKYIDRKKKMTEWNAHTNPNKSKDPHLKKKLLSMGRKILKNEGLSCTGLLRFMEHKNLAVKWIPSGPSAGSKDGNYVRVMPRLKGKNELIGDNVGWKNRVSGWRSPSPEEDSKEPEPAEAIHVEVLQHPPESIAKHDLTTVPSTDVNGENPALVASVERSLPNLLLTELLTKNDDNKKLLNANPVANPKQLPKKLFVVDSKNFVPAAIQNVSVQNGILLLDNENSQASNCEELKEAETVEEPPAPGELPEEGMCLPIITSTTSLVSTSSNEENNKPKTPIADVDTNKISSTEKAPQNPAPFRLKVKPVSEINSAVNCKSVLNESNRQPVAAESVWTFAPAQIQIAQVQSQPAASEAPEIMEIPDDDDDFQDVNRAQNTRSWVIMDTVELPNTKTDSPFRYIQDLLKIHNIVLMDPHETITSEFTSLIKFKLQIQRPVNQTPFTLCLSVHCHLNKFYLGVRDPNSATNLDLNRLPANWQWEILKIYTTRDDVIAKMTQTAQKTGRNMYEYTQTFFAILKSITFKNVT